MRADIHLKRAGTTCDPWQTMALAFTAGGVVFGPLGGVIGYLFGAAVAFH